MASDIEKLLAKKRKALDVSLCLTKEEHFTDVTDRAALCAAYLKVSL